MGGKTEIKAAYFDKLRSLLDEYKSIFIVGIDNVSSQQMHEIRLSLRGEGVVLMGKNTMVRFDDIYLGGYGVLMLFKDPPCYQGLRLGESRVRASPSSH